MLTQLFLKLTYVGAEWVMWMLLLLSIISIALMVERWLYFFRTKIDGDELAARLDEQLRARNLQGAWQLVKDTHTYAIESAVVAAGLIALRNGAHAAGRGDAQREGPDAAGAGCQSFDPGHDRQQRAVRRADGHGVGHYQGGPRADGRGGAEQPERGNVRRVRGLGGDGRGSVRRHSGGRCLQFVSTDACGSGWPKSIRWHT